MTWLPLFFGSHAQQKNCWRENGKKTGHHWSIQVSQRQKGRNMTPTIVGFCPWLTSVMVLYGLTVTMRIHQLLTIRKISNYLNHLLMFSSCVCALERHQKLEFRGCNHNQEYGRFASLSSDQPKLFSIDQGNCQRGRAYVEWILCWWSQIITQSGPKWSPSPFQSGS